MYNFKMLKKEQENIDNEFNFNDVEKFIFDNLVKGIKRKDIYVMAKEKYNISESTVNRKIKKLSSEINNYNNKNSIYTYKVYIHKFPNGKKYVGVCQWEKDRWNNGDGYAHNEEMYKDIKKYGWDNIEHKILIEVTDSTIAYQIEKVLIEELDLINIGYNKI